MAKSKRAAQTKKGGSALRQSLNSFGGGSTTADNAAFAPMARNERPTPDLPSEGSEVSFAAESDSQPKPDPTPSTPPTPASPPAVREKLGYTSPRTAGASPFSPTSPTAPIPFSESPKISPHSRASSHPLSPTTLQGSPRYSYSPRSGTRSTLTQNRGLAMIRPSTATTSSTTAGFVPRVAMVGLAKAAAKVEQRKMEEARDRARAEARSARLRPGTAPATATSSSATRPKSANRKPAGNRSLTVGEIEAGVGSPAAAKSPKSPDAWTPLRKSGGGKVSKTTTKSEASFQRKRTKSPYFSKSVSAGLNPKFTDPSSKWAMDGAVGMAAGSVGVPSRYLATPRSKGITPHGKLSSRWNPPEKSKWETMGHNSRRQAELRYRDDISAGLRTMVLPPDAKRVEFLAAYGAELLKTRDELRANAEAIAWARTKEADPLVEAPSLMSEQSKRIMAAKMQDGRSTPREYFEQQMQWRRALERRQARRRAELAAEREAAELAECTFTPVLIESHTSKMLKQKMLTHPAPDMAAATTTTPQRLLAPTVASALKVAHQSPAPRAFDSSFHPEYLPDGGSWGALTLPERLNQLALEQESRASRAASYLSTPSRPGAARGGGGAGGGGPSWLGAANPAEDPENGAGMEEVSRFFRPVAVEEEEEEHQGGDPGAFPGFLDARPKTAKTGKTTTKNVSKEEMSRQARVRVRGRESRNLYVERQEAAREERLMKEARLNRVDGHTWVQGTTRPEAFVLASEARSPEVRKANGMSVAASLRSLKAPVSAHTPFARALRSSHAAGGGTGLDLGIHAAGGGEGVDIGQGLDLAAVSS